MARQKTGNGSGNVGNGERHYASRFAEELQQWLWHGRGYDKPAWSRRKLAEALANSREGAQVSYSTIDKWFNAGHMPEPEAFWALVEVTGWEPEKLRQLTGYRDIPPHVLGPWAFLYDHLEKTHRIIVPDKPDVRKWLQEAQADYNDLPKRPGRRKQRTAMQSPTSAPERAEPVETEDEVSARRRGLVSAGK